MLNLGIDISIMAGASIVMLGIALAIMNKLGYDKDAQAHIFGWLSIFCLVYLTVYTVMAYCLDHF